jgi:hypothetical protein
MTQETQLKIQEWNKQETKIAAMLKDGAQVFARRIQDFERAFGDKRKVLCCIDEGTPFGVMRSAGSGMLTKGDERAVFLRALKEAGVESVMSHAHCGAAGLYRSLNNITDKSVDEVAIESAKKIADELGVTYEGHITELKRPVEFHNARVVYYDASGRFNPALTDEELPNGFVVSRKYMSSKQALAELDIAVSIALGEHGFGEMFTSESPLLIVAVTQEQEGELGSESLVRELHVWLAGNEKITSKTRMKIDFIGSL